ncbi:restriction endonuclease subunit S [Halomonas sp. PBN3]|uniref:restriction endonuclease subunit S n=1 Tax=Halomonas sp. PBN3 TaxID=1397528 RepID=UPI0003B7E7F7|nr:restriction endonuclease subunit S [Halomonas sp. PBN3]ERS87753.1 hypothetical protein Q671_02125 [Halomonas sp. PBN3]
MSERVLPEGWVETTLGQVVEYGKAEKATREQADDDTWVLELEDIEKSSSKILQRLNFSERQFKSTKNRFKKGDVLYGKLRPYLDKVVIAERDGVCTTEIIPLDARPHLDNRYLFYWLKSLDFLSYVNQVGYGVNMPRLGTKDGKAAPFVLAPQEEQKAIADKLDELLAQVANLKARLDAIPAILKRFRQSVLAAAVSGQLYSFDNANGWQDVCVGDLATLVTSGSRGWSKYYSDSGDLFVRAQNIKNDVLDLGDVAYVDLPERAEGTRTKIKEGDFLITITGANVTKCALVGVDVGVAYVSQHVGLVRWSERRYGPYLELFLKSESHGRKQLLDMAYGGGKPGLNLKNIRDVSLRLPSIEEQTEIVHRVDQLFAFADQIEQQVANAQTRVDKLTQSILAKAFRGELTAEWRAAHPELIGGEHSAAALLERIKAEKAKQTPARTRRGGRKATVTP